MPFLIADQLAGPTDQVDDFKVLLVGPLRHEDLLGNEVGLVRGESLQRVVLHEQLGVNWRATPEAGSHDVLGLTRSLSKKSCSLKVKVRPDLKRLKTSDS